MGKIVFSPELHKALKKFSAENFDFSVLATLEATAPGKTVEQSLKALELQWQEKLQPFGEGGYNSLKKYEREMGKIRREDAPTAF